jgi:hypothetical protein
MAGAKRDYRQSPFLSSNELVVLSLMSLPLWWPLKVLGRYCQSVLGASFSAI